MRNPQPRAQPPLRLLPTQPRRVDPLDRLGHRDRSRVLALSPTTCPVPTAKVRYALTGAAVAAAALVGASLWRGANDEPKHDMVAVQAPEMVQAPEPRQPQQPTAIIAGGATGHGGGSREMITIDESPLFASTQRLTSSLVANEAAKQLERRHADVTLALRRLDDHADERVVRDLFDGVSQFRAFGELLIELHDRGRVSFEPNVDSDLRFAVKMFGHADLAGRTVQAAHEIVAPVLRSGHLASISRTLFTRDNNEDNDLLARLITRRPEVFREMFIVLGNDAELPHQLGGMLRGEVFFMPDECGPSWVAPRSELQAREGHFQMMQSRAGGTQQIEIRIQRQR